MTPSEGDGGGTAPARAKNGAPPKGVSVQDFYLKNKESLGLGLLAGAGGLGRTIREPTVNRPGLMLAGFNKYFARNRVQVIGNAESHFLKTLHPEQRRARYREMFDMRVPCVVFCRRFHPDRVFLQEAEKRGVAVFSSPHITMRFMNLATLALELMFARTESIYVSMVDILGVGVVLRGESGVGKSEVILALIERGYSLVSDDVTMLTVVDGGRIVGRSKDEGRSFMEVRGIGIINVASMFGARSVRGEKTVDLVVNLVAWSKDNEQEVERLGLVPGMTKLLGVEIPEITIPVRPGRDIGRLVEVAALKTKLEASGYNAAEDLNQKLIAKMAKARDSKLKGS